MSDLINKIKSSPTPKGQISIEEYERWQDDDYKQTERYKRGKIKGYLCAARDTLLIALAIAATIFAVNCKLAYDKSFDNCLALLEQIETNTAILDQEINNLRVSMGEVDYE